jgi:hypothetical protein
MNSGKNMAKALNYNEQKIKRGVAELLFASGFIKDVGKLNYYDKMTQFQRHVSLNERASTNTLHVSLNFDPSEHLSKDILIAIAERYMEGIGFADQPYLVYKHQDAGHPHIHIVSTNIQQDGKRISLHNLGRNQSEKTRKSIEIEFGLVKADRKNIIAGLKIPPVNAQKVIYGKQATKQAISNVLGMVISQYKFSSLPELNAILGLYHVRADRGQENSKMFKVKGLTYRVLDEKGIPIGSPIKASSFYLKPTLSTLEQKFIENDAIKKVEMNPLKISVEFALAKSRNRDLPHFISELEKDRVSTVLRQNKDGLIYGITFVDHRSKTVFNGSDLGRGYSIKSILDRLSSLPKGDRLFSLNPLSNSIPSSPSEESFVKSSKNLLEILTEPEQILNAVPYPFKKDLKRKKRKQIHL